MDDLLLTRATLFASTEPCSLSKRDMLGLARLAGFDDASPIVEAIAAQPEGLILTGSAVVKRLIRMAEKRASAPAGHALSQPWVDRRRPMFLPSVLQSSEMP